MPDVRALDIRETGGGAVIPVKAVPGSSRDRVVGVLGGCLKVAVSAPAEKGKANKAIVDLLAEALGVGRRDVELVSGPTSSRKEFIVKGLSAAEVRTRLS